MRIKDTFYKQFPVLLDLPATLDTVTTVLLEALSSLGSQESVLLGLCSVPSLVPSQAPLGCSSSAAACFGPLVLFLRELAFSSNFR